MGGRFRDLSCEIRGLRWCLLIYHLSLCAVSSWRDAPRRRSIFFMAVPSGVVCLILPLPSDLDLHFFFIPSLLFSSLFLCVCCCVCVCVCVRVDILMQNDSAAETRAQPKWWSKRHCEASWKGATSFPCCVICLPNWQIVINGVAVAYVTAVALLGWSGSNFLRGISLIDKALEISTEKKKRKKRKQWKVKKLHARLLTYLRKENWYQWSLFSENRW